MRPWFHNTQRTRGRIYIRYCEQCAGPIPYTKTTRPGSYKTRRFCSQQCDGDSKRIYHGPRVVAQNAAKKAARERERLRSQGQQSELQKALQYAFNTLLSGMSSSSSRGLRSEYY